MKEYPLTVFMSSDKMNGYDVESILAASKDGKEVGSLEVSVKRTEKGFELTGTAIAIAPSDLLDENSIATVNERLAKDLGTIGAVQKNDPLSHEYESGQDVDVTYVLNHGGLPLNYGNAIKETFRVRAGRINTTETTNAVVWFTSNDPKRMTELLSNGGITSLTKEWIGKGRPV